MSDNIKATEKKLIDRIADIFNNSQNSLLKRFSKSLRRDDGYPIMALAKKGFYFFYYMLLAKFYFRNCTSVGNYTRAEYKPYVLNNGEIHIGDYVRICSRKVSCDIVAYPGGILEIGNGVSINFGTTICAQNSVIIGENARIGPYCMVHDTDFHIPGKAFKRPEGIPIIIEEGAWLSSRVIILKGSVIGKGSVIAAGSVVSGIIPPNVVAGGVPAKVIKKIDPESSKRDQISEGEAGIDCSIKNKVDIIIKSIIGTDTHELPQNTSVSAIKNWSAENHLLILKSIENEFLFESNESSYQKLSSLKKIYQWVSKSVSDTVNNPHVLNK